MTIKNILIQADNSESFASRLDYAINLAVQNDAHLTALYVVPQYSVPSYVALPMETALVQQIDEFDLQQAELTRIKFEETTGRQNCKAEWRLEKGDAWQHLNSQGRYFDLVVVGQAEPAQSEEWLGRIPDELIISLGRPCLVVPYIGAKAEIPKRILVAWDASHSATRAINDALPMLKNADFVEVVSINNNAKEYQENALPVHDICLHLARHGINTTAKNITSSHESNGNILLSHASDISAELLIMGAYGHSRFRELILGGVTRQLLEEMTLPIFMSH